VSGSRVRELLEPPLHPVALGRVARDHRCGDHLSVLGADRRDDHRDLDQRAIRPHAFCVVVDRLPSEDAAHDRSLLTDPLLGHEHHHRTAERLRRGVPEQPLRATVPSGDHRVAVERKDRVLGLFYDRRQPQARRFLDPLSLGHVPQGRKERLRPLPVHLDSPHLRDPERTSDEDLELDPAVSHVGKTELRSDQPPGRSAQQSLRGRVREQDNAARIDDDHPVEVALDHRTQALLRNGPGTPA
jgi:hypothetical protein